MNIVYFLQREDGCIKIGTTRDYKTRLSNLIRQYGDLVLLGMISGSFGIEEQLHQQFAGCRIDRTEFFHPASELMEFIESCNHLTLTDVLVLQAETLEHATSRIAVKPSVFNDLRDFSNGLRATYDDTLEFLLRSLQHPGETPFEAGQRLREQFQRTHSGVKADKP
jgi:hypothetical protein